MGVRRWCVPACAVLVAGTLTSALPAPAEAAGCAVPHGVGAAQVVLVRATGTRATVTACAATGDGRYTRVLGPWRGRVGARGVAPRDRKREGDRRTPSGVFALGAAFGAGPDPGVRVGWLHADGADVWVDDPASPLYNTRQRLPSRGRWRSAERLAVPAYRFAQVIGYNSRRVPGRGSAIFLHVDRGRATSGCVALPRAALVRLLRWQEPGAVIVIDRAVRR